MNKSLLLSVPGIQRRQVGMIGPESKGNTLLSELYRVLRNRLGILHF